MKLKILFIYIFTFSWLSLYAAPMVDVYGQFNDIALKFLLMGIVVPPVAIYMLYKDENADNPKRADIVATVFLSLILIWIGYEISIGTWVPVWLGLITSFILGLFSLPIVLKVRSKIMEKNGVIDRLFKELGKWIARKLGGNGE
ncbi:hypothetical protein MG296_10535 [Flavobacteriaceae bacterium TK19130]|nr:hypothetical protein [Thermobacterium salinum]